MSDLPTKFKCVHIKAVRSTPSSTAHGRPSRSTSPKEWTKTKTTTEDVHGHCEILDRGDPEDFCLSIAQHFYSA